MGPFNSLTARPGWYLFIISVSFFIVVTPISPLLSKENLNYPTVKSYRNNCCNLQSSTSPGFLVCHNRWTNGASWLHFNSLMRCSWPISLLNMACIVRLSELPSTLYLPRSCAPVWILISTSPNRVRSFLISRNSPQDPRSNVFLVYVDIDAVQFICPVPRTECPYLAVP